VASASVGGSARDGNVGARLSERLGHHPAQAARATGDEGAPIGQTKLIEDRHRYSFRVRRA
jgi:hypothetical protein